MMRIYGGPSIKDINTNRTHDSEAKRIRDDLYSGRTTIRSMPFEDRKLAEERGIITGRDISFAFWDGSYPPPAEIRCHVHKHKHEQIGPNAERVAVCMLLSGHTGDCDFR